MTLSEEEIEKIKEEEEYRQEIRKEIVDAKSEDKKKKGPSKAFIIIIAILVLTMFAVIVATKPSTNFPTDTNNFTPAITTEDIDVVFDIGKYMEKPGSFLVESYGPGGTDGTHWSWVFGDYDVYAEADEVGKPISYINVQFNDGFCDQKSDRYLKKVGLSYPSRLPDVQRDGHLYRWEPYNQSYERLNIYCNDDGTSIVLISETYKP